MRELERVQNEERVVFSNEKYEQVEEPQKKDDLEAWEAVVEQARRNLPNSEARYRK